MWVSLICISSMSMGMSDENRYVYVVLILYLVDIGILHEYKYVQLV